MFPRFKSRLSLAAGGVGGDDRSCEVLDISIEDARNAVGDYLELIGIKSMPVPPQAVATALAAFERYGKGRHPARLNFGDCFAYACARHYNLPLMFKGADFPLTDIEAA